jgi:hypothetical protein
MQINYGFVAAGGMLAAVLAATLLAARLGKWLDSQTLDAHTPAEPLDKLGIVRLWSPLLTAAAAAGAFLGALRLSAFFQGRDDPSLMFLQDAQAFSTEAGAQLMWGVSVAAVLVSGFIVAWVGGEAWRKSRSGPRLVVGGIAVVGIAAAVAMVFEAAQTAGFGGKISQYMIEGLAARNHWPIGIVTDALNGLAGGASIVAIGTACLMAAPFAAEEQAAAAELAMRWRILDRVLYAGAAMLIAGVVEVVALHAWSLAPYAGTSEVKTQADLCTPSKFAMVEPAKVKGCIELQETINHAPIIDSLRRFMRSIAITFGAGFSLLLAALYFPAAIVLNSRQAAIARNARRSPRHDPSQSAATDTAPGARLFKIAATIAPLATGLLSALVDMKFS